MKVKVKVNVKDKYKVMVMVMVMVRDTSRVRVRERIRVNFRASGRLGEIVKSRGGKGRLGKDWALKGTLGERRDASEE